MGFGGDPFVDTVDAKANEIYLSITDEGTFDQALTDAMTLADYVAGNASKRQLAAMASSESTLRLLNLTTAHPQAGRGFTSVLDKTLNPLKQTPRFRIELGLLIDMRDDLGGVFELAGRLAAERTKAVEQFPALAAAMCVVHDTEYTRNINENRTQAPTPLELFDYFLSNNSRFANDLSIMPAPMLVHVVNVTESIEQMQWALQTYGNYPKIGDRFFEIDYDTEHFRSGAPKRVTTAGNYCIRSIKEHGGVCADQAYFAESVAKACGIPSCYVVARGADVSHAWIGFLDAKGRARAWNFDSGRYESYQNLRGTVRDPQTGEQISDGAIGVLAGMLKDRENESLTTAAAGYAAERMMNEQWSSPDSGGIDEVRGILRKPRTGSIDDRLGLLQLALSLSSSVPTTWNTIAEFANAGQFNEKQLDAWSRTLFTMCGNKYPDFSFDVLTKMISAEKNPDRQVQMWEWAFKKYRARPDLASNVRMQQATLMESAGKPDKAWAAYMSIVNGFLNDGPMAVDALMAMERLLRAENKRGAILPYLKDAAAKVKRPQDMAAQFASQSNYFKIKSLYAAELRRSGNAVQADRILRELRVD